MPLTQFIDTQLLSAIQDSISVITDLSFSIYDSNGVLLIPAKNEDRLTDHIKLYTRGRENLEEFIRHGIEKTVMRKGTSLFKGPISERRLFISAGVDNFKIVFVSNPFYSARSEFEDFLIKNGEFFGLSPSNLETWLKEVKIKDCLSVQKMATHLKPLFETLLRCSYEKNMNSKSYRWSKTLTDIAFSIQLPETSEEVYSLVLDAILVLFNVDTVSVMVKEKNVFNAFLSSGRLRRGVQSLSIEDRNPIISKSIESCMPVYMDDVAEIQRLGFPEDIASIHIYPLTHSSNTYGVVVIYNSIISAEESNSILEFCKLVTFVLENVSIQNDYNKCVIDIVELNMTATQLIPRFHGLKEISVIDSLTGLFSRKYFQERFIEEIHRSERYGIVFSFAVIAVDDFRLFNDSEGHLEGDNVLREIAGIARRSIRAYDTVSRFGGEEFSLLMPRTDSEKASVAAERIRKNIKASFVNRWKKFRRPGITVSIGISSFPQNGRSIDEMIENAEAALYKAKSMGKDVTVIYGD
jgi:diguanylate cyclase (GGDEF)-like protein